MKIISKFVCLFISESKELNLDRSGLVSLWLQNNMTEEYTIYPDYNNYYEELLCLKEEVDPLLCHFFTYSWLCWAASVTSSFWFSWNTSKAWNSWPMISTPVLLCQICCLLLDFWFWACTISGVGYLERLAVNLWSFCLMLVFTAVCCSWL